jgi:hypothetical protein
VSLVLTFNVIVLSFEIFTMICISDDADADADAEMPLVFLPTRT